MRDIIPAREAIRVPGLPVHPGAKHPYARLVPTDDPFIRERSGGALGAD